MLIFSMIPLSSALTFTDVNFETEEGKAVKALVEKEIISGYGDGRFGANDFLTRAQAVKIINKLFYYTVPGTESFTDVPSDSWYAGEVSIAVQAGYIKGYGNGLFGPDDTLTKEQLCVMLDNIMHFARLPMDITINDAVSPWAKDSIEKIISNRLAPLKEDGIFNATSYITRLEACTILAQFILYELPQIGEFGPIVSEEDIKEDINEAAKKELKAKFGRVIEGINTDLIYRTESGGIKELFTEIANTMERYMHDESYDYKNYLEIKREEYYKKLTADERDEAKKLIMDFFTDPKYAYDLSELYDFFF